MLSIALYLLLIYHFRFRGTLADADLYRMLRGLLDGAWSGTGFASGLHYGKAFSFGYIFAMYSLADRHILQDPQRLIALINGIGFWSAATGCVCFWASLWRRVEYMPLPARSGADSSGAGRRSSRDKRAGSGACRAVCAR